jgi:putative CocE/NonD family hydrolase
VSRRGYGGEVISAAVTRAAGRALRLPPARTGRITVTRDYPMRARDGARLLTDHYAPGTGTAPTVLIRTPYGRGGPVRLLGRIVAERGFHAVIQSCRGTYGSDGRFEPLVHERADGADTVDWLRRQPWYDGSFGTFGASYQGFVQWALAAAAGEDLKAMVAVVTASQTRDSTYAGEAFSLDTVLTWAELMSAQTVPFLARQVELRRGQPRLAAGLTHLPLAEADRVATGGTVPFFQEWLREIEPEASYWRDRVFDADIEAVTAPVAMVTGWHDIFLPAQLADYAVLRAAGGSPYLTIGPWTHGGPGLLAASLREGLAWLSAHLRGDRSQLRESPVRVFVGGGAGWRDLPEWPPPAEAVDWYLQVSGGCTPPRRRARPTRRPSGTTRATPRRRWAARCSWRSGPAATTTGTWSPGRTC